uniref:L-fucose mutarotase n=1 Tax=Molossus molossus TaxID=27622 RepID=A0A7J8DPK6_MOLMO|nr:hypothetical protein HJG59_009231 [Molossus molossus]
MVVLKGVPALLSPELLFALARMGHGDSIVLADVNFPTSSICKCGPEEIRADGCCHGVGVQRQGEGPPDPGVEELPVHSLRGWLLGEPAAPTGNRVETLCTSLEAWDEGKIGPKLCPTVV